MEALPIDSKREWSIQIHGFHVVRAHVQGCRLFADKTMDVHLPPHRFDDVDVQEAVALVVVAEYVKILGPDADFLGRRWRSVDLELKTRRGDHPFVLVDLYRQKVHRR